MQFKQTSGYVRDKLRKIWPGLPSDLAGLRRSVGHVAVDVGRLTLAAVLGYLFTVKLLPGPVDLTGALTALLVLQASLRGSFRAGMVRVTAVLTGISVALVVATFVGLHWWSLAVVVFAALLMARVLRLGDASLEVAISGMLILGSAGADVAAFTRFATTIIGTVVGIGLPLLWPRKVSTANLTRDLRQVASRLRELYSDAADHLERQPMTKHAAEHWLGVARQVTPLVTSATSTLDEASDVQRWNTNQLFQADVVPLLRGGAEALERSLLSTGHLFRVMQSQAPADSTPDDGYGDEVRHAFVAVLNRLGSAMATFIDLIEAEAQGDTTIAEAGHAASMARVRAAQQQLTGLMMVEPDQTRLWLLRGSILSAIEQIISQIDLTGYLGSRDAWRATQLGRTLPAGSIGPRIRSPWGQVAHRMFRERAQRSRLAHPLGSHEVTGDDTTMLMTIPPCPEEPPSH